MLTAVTWAGYSVADHAADAALLAWRISSLVLAFGWIPLALAGLRQTTSQTFQFGTLMWVCLAFAVVGPLFLTNILWFTAISRVGPSRASLFSNMQPLFGVLFALLLLNEHLTRWELVGGAAILGAVLVERSRRPVPEPPGD